MNPRSMPPSAREADDEGLGERGSWVMRFGGAVAATLLASVIATMPAAVRIARLLGASSNGLSIWIALLALAFGPLAIATFVLRRALAAVRLFDPRTVATGIATVLVWAVATFVLLSSLGLVLRATTHHHGLAGVTFAAGGIGIATVVALFATRLVQVLRQGPPLLRWVAIVGGGIVFGVGAAFVGHVVGRSDAAAAMSVDIVAFTFAAAFGAGAFPHRSRPLAPLALLGPPLAAVVLVVGFATLRASAPLRAALEADAPFLAAMSIDVLSGRRPAEAAAAPALTAPP